MAWMFVSVNRAAMKVTLLVGMFRSFVNGMVPVDSHSLEMEC